MIRLSAVPLTSVCLLVGAASVSADVIEDANRFTVQISSAVEYPFGAEFKGTTKGAGFLIDRERGWVLTNAHVARRAPAKIRVNFKGLEKVDAERVYIDTHLDLSILKVDPKQIPSSALVAKLECDTEPHPGNPVIAFGHPWSLDYTATRGIISGTKSLDGVEHLQTDAALNPGNSGGPLISEQTGVIVGINVSTLNKARTEGMNFAVPSRLACTIVTLLKEGTDPSPPKVPVKFAETLKDRELVVADVTGSWETMLKIGDRVVAVAGDKQAFYASRFVDKIRGKTTVLVTVSRGGEERQVSLDVPEDRERLVQRGIFVSGLLLSQPTRNDVPAKTVTVQAVERASLGEEASIRLDDVIQSIDGIAIKSSEDVAAVLNGKSGKFVDFIVRREVPGERDNYNFLVRRVEIDKVAVVTENGVVR